MLIGGGASGNQHVSATNLRTLMASRGLATIGVSHVGQGSGPLGRLAVTKTDSTVPALADPDREVNQIREGDDEVLIAVPPDITAAAREHVARATSHRSLTAPTRPR